MGGTASAGGSEALLSVEVLSRLDAPSLRIEAVDTGFTGHLTLPGVTVETLGLPIIGSAESILADGSLVMEDVCVARVLWHGGDRPVRVLVSDATPLLVMALMRGSVLRVECVGGGEVSIGRLEEPGGRT